jgi:hypothetical protein
MRVIGAGLGRTGTYSLKLAIDQLGLGPRHHMAEAFSNMPTQVPLWAAALNGQPDWATTMPFRPVQRMSAIGSSFSGERSQLGFKERQARIQHPAATDGRQH